MNDKLGKYYKLLNKAVQQEETRIPLCAAENYISEFSKSALSSTFEGKYSFPDNKGGNSFVGGEVILGLNKLLAELCEEIFATSYINADSVTGINCITVTIMSLLKTCDRVLLTTPEQGGHPSVPIILSTLNIPFDSIPYDYEGYQIDYIATNKLLSSKKYSCIIFCQSDVLFPPDLLKLHITSDTLIIYDATQTLGMIAGKTATNPLLIHNNLVLLGGTHKTLPAPACGLIMTNSKQLEIKLKENITPNYIRNTQPNHIASLILALIEHLSFGVDYHKNMLLTGKKLARALEAKQFNIAKIGADNFTETHQLFILMCEKEMEILFRNAHKYNISLNKKSKKLFNMHGIRIGVQQISQYCWQEGELSILATLLKLISYEEEDTNAILKLRSELISKRIPQFTYDKLTIK